MVDRRLGRGLDFFLSGGKGSTPAPVPPTATSPESRLGQTEEPSTLPTSQLVPSPFQPRKHMGEEELAQLASSIRESGILQPILVRRAAGRYEIVAGERRWRAAQLAGLEQVPVLVRQISDDESAVAGLVENIQREDLNAIEKAQAFRLLLESLKATQEEVARRLGMERSTVANFLRLLDLPGPVREHVSRGTLSMGHARTLLALSEHETMVRLADQSIQEGWSVRKLEATVRDCLQPTAVRAAGTKKASRPVWLSELEESLVDALATPVHIRYGRKRSQIIVECAGREEFERVFQRLKNA